MYQASDSQSKFVAAINFVRRLSFIVPVLTIIGAASTLIINYISLRPIMCSEYGWLCDKSKIYFDKSISVPTLYKWHNFDAGHLFKARQFSSSALIDFNRYVVSKASPKIISCPLGFPDKTIHIRASDRLCWRIPETSIVKKNLLR